MKKIRIIAVIIMTLALSACASSITSITDNYAETSDAVKNFARISAQDWLFGSGIIQGAVPEAALPSWVFDELRKVDAWFSESSELTDSQLGYIVGLRIRMTGPIIKAFIEQYAPGILNIAQVGAVLGFIGL